MLHFGRKSERKTSLEESHMAGLTQYSRANPRSLPLRFPQMTLQAISVAGKKFVFPRISVAFKHASNRLSVWSPNDIFNKSSVSAPLPPCLVKKFTRMLCSSNDICKENSLYLSLNQTIFFAREWNTLGLNGNMQDHQTRPIYHAHSPYIFKMAPLAVIEIYEQTHGPKKILSNHNFTECSHLEFVMLLRQSLIAFLSK